MRYFLFTSLLFASVNCLSQKANNLNPDLVKSIAVNIAANKNIATGCQLPFSSVKVMDCRFDTSKIGYVRRTTYWFDLDEFAYKKMTVSGGLRQTVESFYNSYYKNCFAADSTQLLVLIKRFWVNQMADMQEHQQINSSEELEAVFQMHIQFEFLLNRRNEYLPVKRIDTVFQLKHNLLNEDLEAFKTNNYSEYEFALAKVFEAVNYQLYADKFGRAVSKKSWAELQSFNERRFKYPMLTDGVFEKGIYMSFYEFRNNAPSVTEFRMEIKPVIGKVFYRNTADDNSQILKYWGYCDGETVYYGPLQKPLYRTGNTFSFFNEKIRYVNRGTASQYSNGYIGNFDIPIIERRNLLRPSIIDMETGKIY